MIGYFGLATKAFNAIRYIKMIYELPKSPDFSAAEKRRKTFFWHFYFYFLPPICFNWNKMNKTKAKKERLWMKTKHVRRIERVCVCMCVYVYHCIIISRVSRYSKLYFAQHTHGLVFCLSFGLVCIVDIGDWMGMRHTHILNMENWSGKLLTAAAIWAPTAGQSYTSIIPLDHQRGFWNAL